MDAVSNIADVLAAGARCVADGAAGADVSAAYGRLAEYLRASHGLPLEDLAEGQPVPLAIKDKLEASLREADDDAELRRRTVGLLKALEQQGSDTLPPGSISIEDVRGMIVRLEEFNAAGSIRLTKVAAEKGVAMSEMNAGQRDGRSTDNGDAVVAIGTVTAGESIFIIANSPGASLIQKPERPRLDDGLAAAIKSQIEGCAVRGVRFRSAYIMAALLRLEQSFARFCFDQARPGFSAAAKQLIDRFIANQASSASEKGFEAIDLSIEPMMVEAARIALSEDAILVDERHVLMALLRSTSGFRTRIQKDLEAAAFDCLLDIASSRRPTRQLPTASELFE